MFRGLRAALPCLLLLGSSSPARSAPLDPEVARVEAQVALDVLERFATPYSDVETLFPEGKGATARRRVLSVADVLMMVAVSDADAPILAATLKRAGIEQFELVFEPVVQKGVGKHFALRKSRLTCRAVVPAADEALHPPFFGVWSMRGGLY